MSPCLPPSPLSLSRHLPSAERAAALLRELRNDATLNATQTANAPRGGGCRNVGEAWSTRPTTPPVSGPLLLVSLPFRASPLCAAHKVKTKTVNIKLELSACTQHFPLCTVHWPIPNALTDDRRYFSGRGRWESSQSYLNVTWGCISVSPNAVTTTTSTADLQLRCENLYKK